MMYRDFAAQHNDYQEKFHMRKAVLLVLGNRALTQDNLIKALKEYLGITQLPWVDVRNLLQEMVSDKHLGKSPRTITSVSNVKSTDMVYFVSDPSILEREIEAICPVASKNA